MIKINKNIFLSKYILIPPFYPQKNRFKEVQSPIHTLRKIKKFPIFLFS